MKIFSDNHSFAAKILPYIPSWDIINRDDLDSEYSALVNSLFDTSKLFKSKMSPDNDWHALFLVKEAVQSQYDLLIKQKKAGENIPDKTLCLADTGRKFHGQRNRDWVSLPGNIHLSVFLKPEEPIKQFAPGFNILAAVSVLQTIDFIDDLKSKATVKWVNDILIDNAKVCGFLAHTLTEGSKVTGTVLGIGLNVESSPEVEPTPFVPESSSLKKLSKNQEQANQSFMFHRLIANLARNYRLLLDDGYPELLEIYRQRSIIIGRNVIIEPDPVRPAQPYEQQTADKQTADKQTADKQTADKQTENIEGKVLSIGDNLELFLEGRNEPVFSGRLILKD